MKKTELLSGAGDFETLKVAVKCGADAVYVSLKDYGARKYAKNFTFEELEVATKYCHLYGVRIYVTVNTLVHDSEIDDVMDTIYKLHKIGVDALIMQDVGLICLVRKRFPNMEIHISTQAHNCSLECVKFWESIGVTRVVLARELSLNEIKNINTSLELEVFIHGALCVSYSGQCLISSKMFGRSGNRGECAQVCRFCFDLYKDSENLKLSSKYLLSMKDLCSAGTIKELLDSGVSSLKIEGRMKSKYYVGVVTGFYRKLIDKYYNGESLTFTEDEYKDLLTVYNREFTKGFLGNDYGVVNAKTCNHQGSLLGQVLDAKKKIKVYLLDDLNQEDGIRFSNNEGMICNYIYNENGLLTNKANKGDIVYLDNKVALKGKGKIYKTTSVNINKKIDEICCKKIQVNMQCACKVGMPLSAKIICDNDVVTKSAGVVQSSVNSPISKEQLIQKLSKLGNTPFVLNDIEVDMDTDVFVPIKIINELRRDLVEELISIRENKKSDLIETKDDIKALKNKITNEISFLVRNEEQLKILINKNVNIYTEDYSLYEKYKSDSVFYRPLRSSYDYNNHDNCLITNNGYLNNKYNKSIIDIYMNVYNSLTVSVFSNYAYKIGLSPELNNLEIEKLIKRYSDKYGFVPNVEVIVYGKLELMIMKYCPINSVNNNKLCTLCMKNNYYLDDRRGNKFRLLKDNSHKVRVMDYQNIDKINEIKYFQSIGVTNFRIDLLDESKEEIQFIINRLIVEEVL